MTEQCFDTQLSGVSRRRSLVWLAATLASWRVQAGEAGLVKIGFLRHYEPFSFLDANGQLTGFDVEVMKLLCERLQLRLEPVADTLAGLTRRLSSQEIGWLGNQLLLTPENRRIFDFVRPAYASIQLSGVQHEDDGRDFLSLEDLYGKRLGVLANTGIETQARGVLGKTVVAYESIQDALRDLARQKLDLVLEESLIADYYIEKLQLPLKLAAPFAAPLPLGLAVRKGDRETLERLSGQVRQILADGSLRRISEKWFGFDVSRSRISHSVHQ